MYTSIQHGHRGFLTTELLVALGVFSLAMGSIVSLMFSSAAFGADTESRFDALSRALTMVESYKPSDVEWDAPRTDEFEETLFYGERMYERVSQCAALVRASIRWSTRFGSDKETRLNELIVNPDEARRMGSSCDATLPGEWNDTALISSLSVPNFATALDVQSVGVRTYAYVSVNSVTESESDFYVIDVSDSSLPRIVANVHTGVGITDIVVVGRFVYATQYSTENQLQVISIEEPHNPLLVQEISLDSVDPLGSYPEAVSIEYYDGYLYVGTKETAGPEFHIFDVSEPDNPVEIGFLEINHNVNDIAVYGGIAYLATSADYAELTLIDVSDPEEFELPENYLVPESNHYKFNAKNAAGGAQDIDATRISVVYPYAYVGMKRANSNERDFIVIRVQDPRAIAERGALRLGLSSGEVVAGLHVQHNRAFIVTTDDDVPFRIADVSTSPQAMPACSTVDSGEGAGVAYHGGIVYALFASGELRLMAGSNSCAL